MRTLVTGSAGFVASHLPVIGDVLNIDLADGNDIMTQDVMARIKAFEPEIVFHLAAHHFIPWCEANPVETERTNVLGTANVLEASRGPALKAFVLASSAAVYGYDIEPISETHLLSGKSVYAHSKYRAEVALRQWSNEDARFVAARLFNVVGTGDKWGHVIPEIIHHRHEDILLGNTWPKRDYVHADDVGQALQFLAHHAPSGFTAWNVGTGVGTTVSEIVQHVGDLTGTKMKTITYAGKVRSDDGHLVADPSALSDLGWTAKRTLDDALKDILLHA